MSCSWVPWRIKWDAGRSLNPVVASFLKCHFKRMRRQNSLESPLNSASFILFWICLKSSPFSSTLIFASPRTLLLKLNAVSDTKLPVSLYCSVHSSTILWSAEHFNSSRMFKIFPSCVSNDKSADAHVLPILLLLALWEVFFADSTLQKKCLENFHFPRYEVLKDCYLRHYFS